MPVSVLSDIFSVVLNHWPFISGLLLTMFFSQLLLASALRWILRDRAGIEEYVSLGAAGWILPLLLVAVIWAAGSMFLTSGVSAFVLLGCMAILAIVFFLRTRGERTSGSKVFPWILVTLLVVFILLRLAFVSKVIVPLYFDSAQHYLIVKNLLRDAASVETSALRWPAAYYHIGFHLLTAFTASALRAEIIDAMLILGQMIVAAIPFSVFAIVKQETQSHRAGLFAVLLAAFGWYMPAYAVNWGKYPALTSLPLITFVASLAYLSLRHRDAGSAGKRLWLSTLLVSGVLITGLVHSRSLIVLGIFAFAWIAVIGWQKLSMWLRIVSFSVVTLSLILVIRYIRTEDVFGLLFDPYWEKGLFLTAVVLFLAVFAQWAHPRLAFASILVILFLLCALLIPVSVPGYGMLTLLDRPFVEMILYLPLSFLGGAGLAGLEKRLQPLTAGWQAKRFWPEQTLSAVFIGLLLVEALASYNLYPAGCCEIVGRDDLVAIDWIDQNLPAEARIVISSTELRVLASDSVQGYAGGDAGIWITPLTGRTTILFPYQSDFSQQTSLDTLCQNGADYLYVGDTGTTFNNAQIAAYPDRYKVLLSMPKAQVYQVTGCK